MFFVKTYFLVLLVFLNKELPKKQLNVGVIHMTLINTTACVFNIER